MDYYYIENNSQKGPVPAQELAGIIKPDTRVWCPGMSDWTVASEVAELAVLLPSNQMSGNQSGFVSASDEATKVVGASSDSFSGNSNYSGNSVNNSNSGYNGNSNNYGAGVGYVNGGNSGNNAGGYMNKPQSYLVFSIVTALICCNALSIPAIVYAAKVDLLWKGGFYDEAKKAADSAKMWSWISFGVGLIWGILIIFASVAEELSELK